MGEGGIVDLPTIVYPPVTHHRLAEGHPVVWLQERGHYV